MDKIEMTFDDYILNPMGKKNSVLNTVTRETMKKYYTRKFDNIMLREKGKVNYKLYTDSKNNTYWAHIKVPSETVPKFYYDVVLKFYANASTPEAGSNLFKYFVKFYSNDPAFVFTYVYTFNQKGLFLTELTSKMSKTALSTPAKERNANNDVNYCKIIYFAYLIMQNRSLNKLGKFKAEATELVPQRLLQDITPADEEISNRQIKGANISHRKKVVLDDRTYKKVSKFLNKDAKQSDRLRVQTTKKVGSIKRVSNVSTISAKKSNKK